MEFPLVSIIVPMYNTAGCIARCVKSICTQTYKSIEILLLNDGSTDDTLAVCRALAANDHRIALVDKTNTGAADTRNQGIALAHGKYIQFVDSDDWLAPDFTEKLVSAAEAVERAIGRELQYISGGASTSVHMVLDGTLPARVNHLRIGEFALLGGIYGCYPDFLRRDVFTLRMEVVECKPKPSYPVGELTVDAFGKTREYTDRGIRRRALCAAGRVDCGDPFDLTPRLAGVEVLGASSDHTILDVEDAAVPVRLGDVLDFGVSYGSLVYLTNTPEVRIVYRKGGRLYTAE